MIPKTTRLPSYDPFTSQTERRFFVGLGMAAVAVIAITVSDASRFCNQRETIAATLSDRGLAQTSPKLNIALTNWTPLQSAAPGEKPRTEGAIRPKS